MCERGGGGREEEGDEDSHLVIIAVMMMQCRQGDVKYRRRRRRKKRADVRGRAKFKLGLRGDRGRSAPTEGDDSDGDGEQDVDANANAAGAAAARGGDEAESLSVASARRRRPQLAYTQEMEAFLSNPLTELLFAFLCIVLTACTAIDTLPLSDTEAAITSSVENSIIFIFSLQYIARWWCNGSLRYVVSPLSIIDLCSILAQVWAPLVLLRFTRLLRFVRLLRREDYINVIQILRPSESEEKIVPPEWQLQLNRVLFTILCLLVITAELIYDAEHGVNASISNFFDGFYFAVVSLCSVGYGDIVPQTSAGRAIISIAILVGALLVPFELSQLAAALLKVEDQEGGDAVAKSPPASASLPASTNPSAVSVMKVCPQCASTSHEDDALYCKLCGSRL